MIQHDENHTTHLHTMLHAEAYPAMYNYTYLGLGTANKLCLGGGSGRAGGEAVSGLQACREDTHGQEGVKRGRVSLHEACQENQAQCHRSQTASGQVGEAAGGRAAGDWTFEARHEHD